MSEPTKSARIMQLYDGVRTTREIANIVGCLPAYVRTVARQRKGKGESESDRRYRSKPEVKAASAKRMAAWIKENRDHWLAYVRTYQNKRYREDINYREKMRAYKADWARRSRAKQREASHAQG